MIIAIPNLINSKLPDFREQWAKDNWAKMSPSLKINPYGDTQQYVLDTTGVLGHGLSWGCPIFLKDELILFGVHAHWDSPHWDDVRKLEFLIPFFNDF